MTNASRICNSNIGPAIFVAILIPLCLLGQVSQVSAVNPPHTADLSTAKVASFYESILDTDITSLTRLLAETGTEVVFRGYFRFAKEDMAIYSRLADTIREIKARLPWIHIMGAITCAAFIDGDYWPNGTVVSPEAKQQMMWTLPNGSMPRHYAAFSPSFVLDISKPLARQFILEYTYKLIDAGVDSVFFDEPQYVPWWSRWTYGLKISDKPYVDGWRQIASAVKDNARSRYGKELLVTINNGWVNAKGESRAPDPWPEQDFLSVGVSLKTAQTGSIRDDWSGYKAQIKKVYGRLPTTISFIDYPEPLTTFSKMPSEEQARMLKLLHDTALREGLLFAYPLHGGIISEYMPPPHEIVVYDAVEQGTYDAIRQLTNSLVRIYSQTLTSTLTQTVTEERTITAPGEIPSNLMTIAVAVIVIVAALGSAVIVLKRPSWFG